MENFYNVLGVRQTATFDEIRAAYKRLAFQYHPDRNKGSRLYEEQFKRISEAWSHLSDPHLRQKHDSQLSYHSGIGQHARTSTTHNSNYQGASPYGSSATYDWYRNAPSGSRGSTGPAPYTKFRARKKYPVVGRQDLAIGLLIIACLTMFCIWLNNVMERKAAEEELSMGRFAEALRRDSTYGEAWFAASMAYKGVGYYDVSLNCIEKAMVLADERPADWFYERALLRNALTLYQGAAEDFERFLATYPSSDSARLKLALIQFGPLHQSAKAQGNLLTLSPSVQQSPLVQYTLASIALEKGAYYESVSLFSNAFNVGYLPAISAYGRGLAYLGLQDTMKACADLNLSLNNGYLPARSKLEKCCPGSILQ